MSCPSHPRLSIPCLLNGLVNAYPENLVKVGIHSRTFSKAQSILGNWGGRGFSSSFYLRWSLCPNYCLWFSPLWLSPSWLACGRDACFHSTLLYTDAETPRSLVEQTEPQHGTETLDLGTCDSWEKQELSGYWSISPGASSLPRWGSPACVCPSLRLLQPSSAHLGTTHFLFSPASGYYPSQPGSAREMLSDCAALQGRWALFSVILSHLNRKDTAVAQRCPKAVQPGACSCWDRLGIPLSSCSRTQSAGGSIFCLAPIEGIFSHLCIQHIVSDRAVEPLHFLCWP